MPAPQQILSTFQFVGTAQLDETFGFFEASSATQIQRLQLIAQVGAVGGNVVIELVDENGISYGQEVTLASATSYIDYPLPGFITLQAGDIVRAKIVEVDAGVAGYFTLNLFGAVAALSSGPCCCGPCSPCC